MISASFTYDGGHFLLQLAHLYAQGADRTDFAVSPVRRDRGLHTISARSTYVGGHSSL